MFVGDIPEEPLDLFLLFWTPAVLESIVEQTNLYAQQQGSHFETSQQELRAFLGVLIRMSLVMAASLHLYWDREGPCTLVSNVFSRERFELMRRYLHLNDNTQMPESGSAHFDPLFKVRPLLDAVRQRFMQLFVPGSSLCIDETLIPTKARCSFRRYLPRKPHRNGIRVFCNADAQNGFLVNFLVDTASAVPPVDPAARTLSFSSNIVRYLLHPFEFSNRVVAVDRLLTSVSLAEDLFDKGLYLLGTCNSNRKDFPQKLLETHLKNRGDYAFVSRPPVTVCAWKDQAVVYCVSTCFPAPSRQTVATVRRKIGSERREITCPPSLARYNQLKAGVDRTNEMVSAYTTYRRSHKWWFSVFHWLFDVTLVNCWILWKSDPYRLHSIKKHVEFRKRLATQLIGDYHGRKRRTSAAMNAERRREAPDDDADDDGDDDGRR